MKKKNESTPVRIIIHNDFFKTTKNTEVEIFPHANDTVSKEVKFSFLPPKKGMVWMESSNGKLYYKPKTDSVGIDSILYTLSAGTIIKSAFIIIEITDPCLPKIHSDYGITTLNTAFLLHPALNDTFCQGTQMQVAMAPKHGSLAPNADNSVLYTPHHGYAGVDTFMYRMCYGSSCNQTMVRIEISDNSSCFSGFSLHSDHFEITSQSFHFSPADVLANDQSCIDDIDLSSFILISGPAKGSLVSSTNGWTYHFPSGFSGFDSLKYQVCRKSRPSHCSSATIFLNVH